MEDFKVNTFCVGAEKSGTTSLYELFSSVYGICLSEPKEPLFFSSFDSDERKLNFQPSKIDKYHKLFKDRNAKVFVDFTPIYYCDKAAIERIADYNSNAKIILLLRDPFERIKSHYNMMCENAGRQLPTPDIMHRLVDRSLYSQHVNHIYKYFDQAQTCIITFESLINEQGLSARGKLSKFLGLEFANSLLPHANSASTPRKYPGLYTSSIFLSRLKNVSRTAEIILDSLSMSHVGRLFKELRDARSEKKMKFEISLSSADVKKITEDIMVLYQLDIIDLRTRDQWIKNGLKS